MLLHDFPIEILEKIGSYVFVNDLKYLNFSNKLYWRIYIKKYKYVAWDDTIKWINELEILNRKIQYIRFITSNDSFTKTVGLYIYSYITKAHKNLTNIHTIYTVNCKVFDLPETFQEDAKSINICYTNMITNYGIKKLKKVIIPNLQNIQNCIETYQTYNNNIIKEIKNYIKNILNEFNNNKFISFLEIYNNLTLINSIIYNYLTNIDFDRLSDINYKDIFFNAIQEALNSCMAYCVVIYTNSFLTKNNIILLSEENKFIYNFFKKRKIMNSLYQAELFNFLKSIKILQPIVKKIEYQNNKYFSIWN